MQKEQPPLNESSPCTSSKKDKDNSNRTTEQASCGPKDADDSSRRGSHSEKDSGYSDNGSDWQHTDVEDQRSQVHSRGSGCDEVPPPSQKQEPERGNSGNPFPLPGSREFPPMYLIKNVVLKQPDMKRSQLLWRTGSRETSGPGSSREILLQQPKLLPATLQFHKPGRSNVTGKNSIASYLPILNSYPRIAPLPGKTSPDKSSLSDECENLSKRVCIEHKSNDLFTIRNLLHQQPKLAIAIAGQTGRCSSSTTDSSSFTTVSSSLRSHSISGLYTPSFLTRVLHRNGLSSIHNRRFLNTVQFLSQSGLLDITLRTKQLLRQSIATDRDIAQLRQHTELLCQVASNPNGNTSLENVHRAMAESGSYPSLRTLQNVQIPAHTHSASRPDSSSARDANGPLAAANLDVPQSQLPTGTSDSSHICFVPRRSQSELDRERNASDKSEKVTIMPPDSSTG
ncbi:uncharacterized protein LOC142993957 [Genypterus blacodes]|uniref:uncharacterized protein LOC142993957 n=1 Tax=Genypterus blacodes TaxID=154954 RepID=UPI003F76323B